MNGNEYEVESESQWFLKKEANQTDEELSFITGYTDSDWTIDKNKGYFLKL
jgi:hypothetical protein